MLRAILLLALLSPVPALANAGEDAAHAADAVLTAEWRPGLGR